MDISPGPPFWRILPDDMDIPLLAHLALSGRPDADIHSRRRELRLYGVLGNSRKLAYSIGFIESSGPGAEFPNFFSQLLAT